MIYQNKRRRFYIFYVLALCVGLLFSNRVQCQVHAVETDTVKVQSDSIGRTGTDSATAQINDSIKVKKHSPKKAALYSAILPGLGQVYNHKYWKLPIIYVGEAVAAGLIYYNYTIYIHLHDGYITLINNPNAVLAGFSVLTVTGKESINLSQFQSADLLSLQESYRRDLDLSVIFAAALYALNIIDAMVDAHLFNFDVGPNLSFRVQPQYIPMAGYSYGNFGLNLNMHF